MSEGRSRRVLVSVIAGAVACGLLATTAHAGSEARLVIDKLSDPPDEAVVGDSFEVKGKVKNVGRRSARGLVTAEVDSDSGVDDVPLGDTVTDRIRPRQEGTLRDRRRDPVRPRHPLGDELFPQIGNGGYDAGHYLIELDYDPVANEFLADSDRAQQHPADLFLFFRPTCVPR